MWIVFICVALISAAATGALIPVARRFSIVDSPHASSRKKHVRPTPLIGGTAIVVALIGGFILLRLFFPELLPALSHARWYALAGAILILLVGGYFDDRLQLQPAAQLIAPIIAVTVLMANGFVIRAVTNPAGGVFLIPAFWLSVAFTFVWLIGMMYSTKLLDGLDGIATGITVIGAFTIFALTQTERFWEPSVGAAALIVAAAYAGFLFFNFPPARAFLGEGGSLLAGLLLGLLAILSGSKIATTLIVVAIPVFDVARVMAARIMRGRSPFIGDRLHLHHLLVRAGVPTGAVIISYWAVGAASGILALTVSTGGKIVALAVLCVIVWTVGALLTARVPQE